jgi:CubicO group peptidase (beta-lactamase class C family)
MELVRPADRDDLLDSLERKPGWPVGTAAGYSEHFAWHLISRLLETVTAEDARVVLRTLVIEPMGLMNTWVGMTDDDYTRNVHRVGVNYDLRGAHTLPLLLERTQRVCCETNYAYGGYTNARDLARFYSLVLHELDAERSTRRSGVLTEFCSPARPRVYDVVLRRECTHGLGFMTDLADHHFGRSCSPASFGHSGWHGGSFGFADPVHRLAVAFVVNGVTGSDIALARRPTLVRAVYEDLGLVPLDTTASCEA